MEHQHISKVLEWGFTAEHNFEATLWGCVLCDVTADKPFEYEDISIDHTACDEDCFGCKAKGLQLNTGDSARDIPDKKWNAELAAYRDAKAQGIQPGGTTMAHEKTEPMSMRIKEYGKAAAKKSAKKVAKKAVMKKMGKKK